MGTILRRASAASICLLLIFSLIAATAQTAAPPKASSPRAVVQLGAVDAIINQAIADGNIPGAVLVVGHNGKVIYRKAYGNRALEPKRELMTLDTIFDLASLTKVIATTTAVMQLVEQGKIDLDAVVNTYLDFKIPPREGMPVTMRHLTQHTA